MEEEYVQVDGNYKTEKKHEGKQVRRKRRKIYCELRQLSGQMEGRESVMHRSSVRA